MTRASDSSTSVDLRTVSQLRQSGKLGQAASLLNKIVARTPDDVEARSQLAEVLVEQGHPDGAISEYVKTQEHLAERGDILGAIAAGLKVLELDPDVRNPLAHVAKFKLETLRESQAEREAQALASAAAKALPPIPLLSELSHEELSSVAATMRRHELSAGSVVFEEGATGDAIYFVHRGELEATANGARLGRIGAGQCFGEFSFLTNEPRNASVHALADCELLELSADRMRGVVDTYPRVREVLFELFRERALVNILSRSPLFEALSVDDCVKLAPRLGRVRIPAGDAIIREGDEGGTIYLVIEGSVVVRATIRKQSMKLATLGPHQFFGELPFLKGGRIATVHAREETELLQIEPLVLDEILRERPRMKETLERYHIARITSSSSALKAFLRQDRVDGIVS